MRLAGSWTCRLALVALVIAILISAVAIIEFRRLEGVLADNLCGVTVRRIVPAPDAKAALVTFEVDCGATTPFSTQVTLVPSGASFSREKFPAFLAIKGRHDLAPRWLNAQAVDVPVPSSAEFYQKKDLSNGVHITYSVW